MTRTFNSILIAHSPSLQAILQTERSKLVNALVACVLCLHMTAVFVYLATTVPRDSEGFFIATGFVLMFLGLPVNLIGQLAKQKRAEGFGEAVVYMGIVSLIYAGYIAYRAVHAAGY